MSKAHLILAATTALLAGCQTARFDRPVGLGSGINELRLSNCRCGDVVSKDEIKDRQRAERRAEREQRRAERRRQHTASPEGSN